MLVILIISLIALVYFLSIFFKKPRGYIPFNKRNLQQEEDFPDPISRDRYLSSKLPKKVENIIIGSGISGMATASILSRVGRSCIVLEQHYVAGGWTHTFKLNDHEFNTGVHYLMTFPFNVDPLRLITDEPIQYEQLGKDTENKIADQIFFRGESLEMIYDKKNFIENIQKKFPHQKNEIANFFNFSKQVPKAYVWLLTRIISKLVSWDNISNFINKHLLFKDMSIEEAFKKHNITDFRLQSYIGSYFLILDVGTIKSASQRVSYFVLLILLFGLTQGAIFPKHGGDDFANKILPVIYKNGNKVLVGRKVKRIVLNKNNDAVLGVEMENGDLIQCKNVISSIGVVQTYEKFLPQQIVQNDLDFQYLKKNVTHGQNGFIFFVGLKGTSEELKIPSYNIFHVPDSGYSNEQAEQFDTIEDILKSKNILYFLTSSTAKQYPSLNFNKNSLEVLAFLNCDKKLFEKWENQETNHREQDYNDFKQKLGEKMLQEVVYRYLPQCKDQVEFVSVGTPLTVDNYINSKDGNWYGIQKNKKLYEDFRLNNFLKFQNQIKGLYLTGQDLLSDAVQINAIIGILTASKILGYWSFWDFIQGRNFFLDFWNLLKAEKKQKQEQKSKKN